MSKEKYNQIIDEVYGNYLTKFEEDNSIGFKLRHKDENGNSCYGKGNREMFINKCKTDPEFSEEWGLKIEERDLDADAINVFLMFKMKPTKLITLTHNNETIEVYE